MAKKETGAFQFASFDRETLQERIYRELRRALMSGAVRPGQVVSSRTLAEMLGTSPMPVRDAIRRLVTEHALIALPNRTMIVPDLTEKLIDEIYKIRIVLEGLATEEAAARISKAELKELAALEDKMVERLSAGKIADYLEANWQFHFSIYNAAGLPQLLSLIEGLWLQIGPSISRQRPENHSHEISYHHRKIIDALAAGDAVAARDAIVADISQGREALKASLGQEDDLPAAIPSPKRGRPRRTQ